MGKPDEANGDIAAYAAGQVAVGRVVGLEHYGAYVELRPDVIGLVLIPEISWSRVRHPGEVLQVGDEVRAEVLVVNGPMRKLSLSVKRQLPPPAGQA